MPLNNNADLNLIGRNHKVHNKSNLTIAVNKMTCMRMHFGY